jgi:hypothetical protein
MERRIDMKKAVLVTALLAVLAAALAPAVAEEAGQAQAVSTAGFKTEIVRLKYVKPKTVIPLLLAFRSERGRLDYSPDSEDSVITVSDLPENVSRMLAAIREIDIKPADVLFTVQLILGSDDEGRTDPELQSDPVIKELRSLLRFKNYALLDSTMVRCLSGKSAQVVMGKQADFELGLRPEVTRQKPLDMIKVEVMLRQVVRAEAAAQTEALKAEAAVRKQLIVSALNIRSGDRTVVGVSRLGGGDKGIILIISAKATD